MQQNQFPLGWDEKKIRRVINHYEKQSEEEAVAEDEAELESSAHTMMQIPTELVSIVRELIAKHQG